MPSFVAPDPLAYDANPLVARMKAENPALFQLARRDGPPPQLFGRTALPTVTRSGIDPARLASLPWWARWPVANADAAEANAIIAEMSGPGAADIAVDRFAQHPGNREYVERLRAWASGRGF